MGFFDFLFGINNDNDYDDTDLFVEDEEEDSFVGLRGRNRHSPLPNFNSPNYNQFRDGGFNVSLSPRKGYGYFGLVGMYYNLTEDNYGKFNGYAVAETDNVCDDYAIAIYEENGHKIGHLPKGNKKLHNYILNEGGKVHAYGYVQITFDGMFDGAVCVEINKNEVTKRNAPYCIPESDKMRFDGSTYIPQKHNFKIYESTTPIEQWVFPTEWVGKKFSIIGSCVPYDRYTISNWIKENGGFFVMTISSKVDYVFDFGPSTNNEWGETKQRQMQKKYNTKCITPIEFFNKVKSRYTIDERISYY